MTKKLKVRKNSASASSGVSDPERVPEQVEEVLEPQDEIVEEELEIHDEAQPSLVDKARGILGGGIESLQDKLGTGEKATKQKKKWVPPEKRKEQEGNIATLITSLLIMIVASLNTPDDLKPNEDEINAVSGFSVSILLRHVNISGRLTADVIDVIGIVAVSAGYWARTSKARQAYTLAQAEKIISSVPEVPPSSVPTVDTAAFMRP
jgi:hypothetical protein